jgi:hypothetical protein
MTRWVFAGCFALVSQGALSQSCDQIILHGFQNVSLQTSDESAIALKYYSRCEINQSTYTDDQLAKAEVEIFGEGSGNGQYSRSQREARINNWCQDNKDIAQSHKASLQASQTIYQGSVEAWNNCNNLMTKDVQIRPQITPDAKTVDIGIRYTGGTKSGVTLMGIPTENFTCNATHPENSSPIKFPYEVSNQAVQVHCIRAAATQETLKDQIFAVTPRGTITIQTSSDPFQLYFAEAWVPPAPLTELEKLLQRVNVLELTVKKQAEKLEQTALKKDVNIALGNIPSIVGNYKQHKYAADYQKQTEFGSEKGFTLSSSYDEAVCPEGWVAVGWGASGAPLRALVKCSPLRGLEIK